MELGRAYMRREQWRARVLAVAVAKVLVGDAGNETQASRTVTGKSGKRYRAVAPAEMLKIAGVSE